MTTVERVPADVDEATFTAIGGFLVEQSRELAQWPVDIAAATNNGYNAIAEGMTILARDGDGEIVGTLCLVEAPVSWAADPGRKCLVDFWFVVRPDHRDGKVRHALTEEAKLIGEERGLHVFVFKRVQIR